MASGQQSDHLLMVAAFDGWMAASAQVCTDATMLLQSIEPFFECSNARRVF